MKTAFKIHPAPGTSQPGHLLIEAGENAVSFVLYEKDPLRINGIMVFNQEPLLPHEQAAQATKNLIEQQPLLLQHFLSVSIIYNSRESVLVPAGYFHEPNRSEMLELLHGADHHSVCFHETIPKKNIVNVYRVGKPVDDVYEFLYPGALYWHASSLALNNDKAHGNELTCVVYHNSIKLILYKENQLQLVQQFPYSTATDAVYHLLNVCEQHGMAPASTKLLVAGMIDSESNLYREFYKYFLDIDFDSLPEEVSIAGDIKQYPPHFFSHLIQLVTCVS